MATCFNCQRLARENDKLVRQNAEMKDLLREYEFQLDGATPKLGRTDWRAARIAGQFGVTTQQAEIIVTLYESHVPMSKLALSDSLPVHLITGRDATGRGMEVQICRANAKHKGLILNRMRTGYYLSPEGRARVREVLENCGLEAAE